MQGVFGLFGLFFLFGALSVSLAPQILLALDKVFTVQLFTNRELIRRHAGIRITLGLLFLCASYLMLSLCFTGGSHVIGSPPRAGGSRVE